MGKQTANKSGQDDLVIKPTSDIFNAVLWSAPKNQPLLQGFLNAVLRNFGAVLVNEATVLNPFNIKEFAVDKNLILDVRVRDELNRQYNIEVQTTPHSGFRHRSLLYWADTYSSLLRVGEKYTKLVPVKSVILTEFPIFPELKNLHTVFEARSRENPEVVLSDHFQMHFLRLGDMLKRQMAGLDKLDRELQHWMNFFAFGNTLSEDKMSQLVENDILVQQAYEEFQRFTANAEMREKVRQRQRFLEDQKIYLDAAKDEGIELGEIRGEIRGEIKTTLRFRFDDLPDDLVTYIAAIDDLPTLTNLAKLATKCDTLAEFAEAVK